MIHRQDLAQKMKNFVNSGERFTKRSSGSFSKRYTNARGMASPSPVLMLSSVFFIPASSS